MGQKIEECSIIYLLYLATFFFISLIVVPERPILKHLCTVVIWKPPTVPNGEIQGYELKFINSAGLEEVFNYTATDNFQLTSDIQREENVLVQVSI